MDEKLYWLGWQILLSGTPLKFWAVARGFDSLERAWKAPEKELIQAGLKDNTVEQLLRRRQNVDLQKEFRKLKEKGIDFVCYHDNNYPKILKDIYDPPGGIFVKGVLRESGPSVSLVGSRKATPYGKKVSHALGKELAKIGVTVVSGMARGIDTAAHKGALEGRGKTLAVLGCGLDVVYPPENKKVMDEIAKNGAVISEFPLGSMPEPWHFPLRNRVISGLSNIVVVVEAGEKSGALITADQALEQGRDVAAVPGNVSSNLSKGPNKLIKQGAKLVENVEDILCELGINSLFPEEELVKCVPDSKLPPEEQEVFKILGSEPMYLDEIITLSGRPPGDVLSSLMYLEMKGFISQLPGKMFLRN